MIRMRTFRPACASSWEEGGRRGERIVPTVVVLVVVVVVVMLVVVLVVVVLVVGVVRILLPVVGGREVLRGTFWGGGR